MAPLLSVFVVIFNTLAAAATLLHAYDIVYIAKLLTSPWVLLGLFVVAAVGLLYLWRLLRLPDRLYWEPLPVSSLSKTQHKQQERGLRLQRIGFGLFSIPLAIAIAISFAVSQIMVGPDGGFGGSTIFKEHRRQDSPGRVHLSLQRVGLRQKQLPLRRTLPRPPAQEIGRAHV